VVVLLIPFISLYAQVTGLAGWDIFVDPGHSQKENMGIYNHSEAERNLRVALNLRDLLLNTTDIDTVYLCRTNDQQLVSLSQRTDLANRLGASWYHSIHSDAETPPANSTMLLWGQYYNGQEKVPHGGKEMADIMVNLLTRGMRVNTRGSIGDCSYYTWSDYCKTSGGPYLHVNRTTSMPSELSEAGSHTNPTQNQRFMNAEWKRLEAYTLYWSILQYFEIERPPVGIATGIIKDFETSTPVNGARVEINGQIYTTDTFEALFYKYSTNPEQLHNGFYFIENLPPDQTLEMIVAADGFYRDTLNVTIGNNFFTFKDVTLISTMPPKVLSTIPAEGATNVPAWENVVLHFSRPMDTLSVRNHLTLNPASKVALVWSEQNTQLTLVPDSLEFETNYAITVGAETKDVFLHPFDGNGDGVEGDRFLLTFVTGPRDMTAPNIAVSFPPQNGKGIELLPIVTLTFDETIDSVSVTDGILLLERFKDHSPVNGVWKHYVLNRQSVFCFFPAEKLFPNELYVIRVYPGLQDLFGNEMTKSKSYTFKTTDTDVQLTKIDDFERDLTANWWNPQQSGTTAGILTEVTNRAPNTERVNLATGSAVSFQANYGWDLNASAWIIRLYLGGGAPRNITFDASSMLQIYVFGDGSGNQFRFALDDNYPSSTSENHEVSPWYPIDWIGWKLVSWNMRTDGTGEWLGDGNLDGRLRFDSIQLTYNPGSPVQGTLYFDDLQLAQKLPAGVDEPVATAPETYRLYQNYPNPFNPTTTISYQVAEHSVPVKLTIFDALGQEVRALVHQQQSAGNYAVIWDGRDNSGRAVASGTYLYKLTAGDFTQTRQMVLIQ
jgi:N-acetylmuramoyl-L-alanine amidase